jgi:hypothetical protein
VIELSGERLPGGIFRRLIDDEGMQSNCGKSRTSSVVLGVNFLTCE